MHGCARAPQLSRSVRRLMKMRQFLLTVPLLLASIGSLADLLAVAAPRPDQQPVVCTRELEGRLVEASSGAWLNIPFIGTLVRRTSDGHATPAARASISIASEPCPRGKPHPLRLDSAGRFDEK